MRTRRLGPVDGSRQPRIARIWMAAMMIAAAILPLSFCQGDEGADPAREAIQTQPPRSYTAPDLASRAVEAIADPAVQKVVYVPAYSHIYGNGGHAYLLEIMLSVRNTNETEPIILGAVRYYDTAGELVRTFVDQPVRVGPMETLEFLVERRDSGGGSGANFIVEWMAEEIVQEPVIDAVMVAADRQLGLSIVRRGVTLEASQ